MRTSAPSILVALACLSTPDARAAVDCTALPTDAEQIGCLNARVEHLISMMRAQDDDLSAAEAEIEALSAELSASQDDAEALESRLESVEGDALTSADLSGYATEDWVASQGYTTQEIAGLSDYLSVDAATDSVIFSGANVFVQSGAGSTDAAVNGLGNLIVGYDEDLSDDKSGSHNLVIGHHHSYSSYGGLVAGYNNDVHGQHASVIGGALNTALGERSTVSGGALNTASGSHAAVAGGVDNVAGDWYSAILGGQSNTTSDSLTTVVGGYGNEATKTGAAVLGGYNNVASGSYATVYGGYYETASSSYDYAP